MENHVERVRECIAATHRSLAAFAKDSFASDGRGLVQVEFPHVAPGSTIVAAAMMNYIDIAESRALLADSGAEGGEVILRMLDTYDPTTQAVVLAAIEGHAPVSMKIKLELPAMVAEAEGVH